MKRKSHQYKSDNVRSQTSSDSRPISGSRSLFKGLGDDAPKTSEYAFFKKLKKDAGRTSSLCPLPKEDCQINKPKSSDRDGACDVIRNCFKKLKSSLPCDNVDPRDVDCLSSPINYPSEISEKKANHSKTSGRLYSVTPVTLNEHFSPFQERVRRTGSSTQFQQDGVFSLKRQRLRQLATEVIATESDNRKGKGTDVVSELLARLFPESNDDQKCREQELSKEDDDAKSELMFRRPDFEINSNTCYWSPTWNYNEPEVVMRMADSCVTFLSDHSRKADPSRRNVDGIGFLGNFTNKFHPPYQMLEHFDGHDRYQPINFSTPYQSRTCKYIESRDAFWLRDGVSECASDQQRVADFSSWNEENMDYLGNFSNKSHFDNQLLEHFDSPQGNYQSSHYPNYLEGMKYHSNDVSSIRQPQPLLLGWKYDEPKDPHDFPVASDDIKLYDILPAFRNAGCFCDSGDTLGTDGLCFQHFLPKLLASSRRPHFSLHFRHDLRSERYMIEAEEHLDPPFSHQAEDTENFLYKYSNIFLSPQNHYWSTREIGRDNLYPKADSPRFPPPRSFGSELLRSLKFHQEESMSPLSIHRKDTRTGADDSVDEILSQFTEGTASYCSHPTFRTALEQDQAFLLPQDMFSVMNMIDRSQRCLHQKNYYS